MTYYWPNYQHPARQEPDDPRPPIEQAAVSADLSVAVSADTVSQASKRQQTVLLAPAAVRFTRRYRRLGPLARLIALVGLAGSLVGLAAVAIVAFLFVVALLLAVFGIG